MTSSGASSSGGTSPRDVRGASDLRNDEPPGVPGFRTWRGVYLFVLACFALMVIALTIFARFYA